MTRERPLGHLKILSFTFIVAACLHGDPGTAIQPAAQATADALVFRQWTTRDTTSNRYLLAVILAECDRVSPQNASIVERAGRIVWKIERQHTRTIPPLLIHYGELPSVEWHTIKSAERLEQGCYVVRSLGGGIGASSRFEVRPDRTVSRLPAY